MAAGLELWSADGVKTLSLTERPARVMGSFTVPSWSGKSRTLTYQIPSSVLNEGTIFLFWSPFTILENHTYGYDISITSNASGQVTVKYAMNESVNVASFKVWYGVY